MAVHLVAKGIPEVSKETCRIVIIAVVNNLLIRMMLLQRFSGAFHTVSYKHLEDIDVLILLL